MTDVKLQDEAEVQSRDASGWAGAWPAVLAAGLVTVFCFAIVPLSADDNVSLFTAMLDAVQLVVWAPLFAWLGALIVAKRANGRIGWLFILVGSAFALSTVVEILARDIGSVSEVTNVGVWLILWAYSWVWMLWVLPIFLLLYIFPTGRLLSRRWRWAPWTMLVIGLDSVIPLQRTLETWHPDDYTQGSVDNPIGVILSLIHI